MKYRYGEPCTEGPSFDEVMNIAMNLNEKKATSSKIKPQIMRLGGARNMNIIFEIIRGI